MAGAPADGEQERREGIRMITLEEAQEIAREVHSGMVVAAAAMLVVCGLVLAIIVLAIKTGG